MARVRPFRRLFVVVLAALDLIACRRAVGPAMPPPRQADAATAVSASGDIAPRLATAQSPSPAAGVEGGPVTDPEARPCQVNPDGDSWPCASGFVCIGGRCSAPRSGGEPCGFDWQCAAPLICAEDGHCRPRRPVGEPCRVTSWGEALAGDPGDCGERLICWNDRCAPRRKQGETCGFFYHCESQLTCVDADMGSRPPVVGTCGPRKKRGEACGAGLDVFAGRSECAEGLACLAASVEDLSAGRGGCSPRVLFGGRCLHSLDCVPAAACRAGTCIPRHSVPAAGPCDGDDQCEAGTICEGRRCEELHP